MTESKFLWAMSSVPTQAHFSHEPTGGPGVAGDGDGMDDFMRALDDEAFGEQWLARRRALRTEA